MIHSRSGFVEEGLGWDGMVEERVRTREERRSGVREEPKRAGRVEGLRDCDEGLVRFGRGGRKGSEGVKSDTQGRGKGDGRVGGRGARRGRPTSSIRKRGQ